MPIEFSVLFCLIDIHFFYYTCIWTLSKFLSTLGNLFQSKQVWIILTFSFTWINCSYLTVVIFVHQQGLEKNRKENEPEEKEMEWSVTDKTADKELTVSNEVGITEGKAEDTDVDSDMNNQLVGTLFTTPSELSSHNSKDNDGLFVVGEKETYNDFISKCDDGWITPANIHHVKNEMGKDAVGAVPAASVSVCCLTTDFAMQVISFDILLN